jgi:hypothetical protein
MPIERVASVVSAPVTIPSNENFAAKEPQVPKILRRQAAVGYPLTPGHHSERSWHEVCLS